MKAHPIAAEFPPYEPDQLKLLADDIKANGLRELIATFEGKILDGLNRFEACKIAKVSPEYYEFQGTYEEAIDFVISKNLRRRNLSKAVRAEIAARLATMKEGRPKKTPPNGGVISQKAAAEKLGVPLRSVQRASAKIKGPKEPKEAASWSMEELKEPKNAELFDAFKAIAAVYGNEDTKAIRTGIIGLKKKDILALAKQPKEKMLECHNLIMAKHWTPDKALKFLSKMPDNGSTVEELKHHCLGTKGLFWTGEFEGYTITVRKNSAVERKSA